MKRVLPFLLTYIVSLMSVSCVDEISDSSLLMQEITFTASFDASSETKTILVNGREVYWLPGDRISISGAPDAFTSLSDEQSANTIFSGTAFPADEYYAIYPYDNVFSWMETEAMVTLVEDQPAVKGTFANGVNLSAAYTSTDDMSLIFHNIIGYIKFTVSENSGSIKSVEVRSNGGEFLSGVFNVGFDDATKLPVITSTGTSQSVRLSSEFVLEPGDYYIAMIPGTYTEGLTLKFTDAEGAFAEKSIDKELTLSAGKIKNIGTVKGLVFETIEDRLAREREALVAIYESLGGDNWYNNKNWCSDVPVSEWYGIYTDDKGYVSSIQLEGNNISGYLSPEIGVLKYLNSLNLSNNSTPLESVPEELALCRNLFTLKLEGVVKLPDVVFSMSQLTELSLKLTEVDYPGNKMPSMCQLTNLGDLNLIADGLEIPESIGNMVELYNLNLCGFTGAIPSSIGNLDKLQLLSIHSGTLTGGIPPSIGNISGLRQLHLNDNGLTGNIPEEICQLPALISCDLSNNSLSGLLPEHLADMMSIIYANVGNYPRLDLRFNSFIGAIPEAIYENSYWRYVWYDFYDGNELDFDGVPIPMPHIEGYDIYGEEVDTEKLLDERPYLLLYQYADSWGLSEMLFPNIASVKELCAMYPDTFNVLLWGEEDCTAASIEAIATKAGVDDWIICTTAMAEQNRITVNGNTYYPTGTYPYFFVVDNSGNIIFSSKDFNTYELMDAFFDKLLGSVETDYYISTDYSADGSVNTLQKAEQGAGIDVVLMGDAYSDRLIADGTYAADMQAMADAFFQVEPYKTYRDYFNVYSVNVVSENEVYDTHSSTALDGRFGDGTMVGGNDYKCFTYALKAIVPDRMDDAMIIVAMNSDRYAGTCYMYYPASGNYGNGTSVSYFPVGGNREQMAQLLHHEACGHGFAKLGDEYAYEENGTVPSSYVTEVRTQLDNWGWWKNVDFTSDPSQVRWSHFLEDERYQYDGLGCFEGGLTYWSGVWRPTENSIMRYNTGGFNAPSREAIWYRIHKLAYGDSWEYDYEDFVVYDAVNRTTSTSVQKSRKNYVEKPFEPTSPPVVVGKSWRDALN